MKKQLQTVYFAVIILFVANISFAQTTNTQLKIEGLKQEVSVRKDSRGIPYIDAKNDDDLYFTQGFITASDRLWQMDLLRRAARGETAEIFGKMTLEEDKRWRKFGFAKIAEESLPNLSKPLRSALDNYTRGVNAYIATLDDKTLPVEFKLLQYKPRIWLATDTIVIGKILADGLSSTWQNDMLRASLQKTLSPEKFKEVTNQLTPYDVVLFGKDDAKIKSQIAEFKNKVEVSDKDLQMAENEANVRRTSLDRIGFYAEELAASNNWVISGKRTADGKPIMANDPHLPPRAPGIWYLAHLSSPSVQTSGVTFPGVPGIVLGHNESIAWGATNVGPDVQDLYIETFNAEGKYKTPNGWETPVIRKEEIKVRKNPLLPETETVNFDVTETRNGVIYTEDGGQKFALKWTARDPKNQEFEAFFMLNRAKNWADFQTALKTYGGATQNFVYADVKGNIGWIAAGRVPIRKTGDGAFPYDGSINDGEWTGYIPFAELPNQFNPASGFIVTANQRIVGNSYKYQQMSRDAALPWRAKRIYELIDANSKITIKNVVDIQRDVKSIPHKKLSDDILKLSAASNDTLSDLRGWDGKMHAESRAALIINETRNCLANKIANDNKPIPSWIVRERLIWRIVEQKPSNWLPKEFASYTDLYKTCDTESRESLTKRFGNNLVWGSLSKANFPHPLAAAPLIGMQFATPNIGIDGSGVTPNVGSNVSMRHIAVPNNWDETRHVIPLGQSGNPASPHYKDQFDSWNKGDLPIFPFSKSAVEKAAKETLILSPK